MVYCVNENRKSIPTFFNDKKLVTLQLNVIFQILNFVLVIKLNNRNFLHPLCNVDFVSVFTILNYTKKLRKFNITPYGEIFL